MNAAVLLSVLACLSSFYIAVFTPKDLGVVKSVIIKAEHPDIASIIECLENLAREHQMKLIAFNPVFERGAKVFAIRLESSFQHFNTWYLDVLQKIPKLKWQHVRLKPKGENVLVVLEGIYDI